MLQQKHPGQGGWKIFDLFRGKKKNEVLRREGFARPVERPQKLAIAEHDIPAEAVPVPVKAPLPADRAEQHVPIVLKEELAKEMSERSDERAKLAEAVAEAIVEADEEQLVNAEKPMPPRSDFVAVRVYAHPLRPNRQPGERVDFTETLFWNAGIRTDAKTGEAKVSFSLNDSVTTFRVFADAFSDSGALGQGTGALESVEPFYVEPKLPLEVTSGDVIQLPVSIVSGIGSDLPDSSLTFSAGRGIKVASVAPFALRANARGAS
jgi:hypothetical protein